MLLALALAAVQQTIVPRVPPSSEAAGPGQVGGGRDTAEVVPDEARSAPISERRNARAPGDRQLVAFTPLVWTSTPGGPTAALRAQSAPQRRDNRVDVGLAISARAPDQSQSLTKLQGWVAVDNPRFPGGSRAALGVRASAWLLDGTAQLALGKAWGVGRAAADDARDATLSLGATAILPYDRRWPDPARWSLGRTYELRGGYERSTPSAAPTFVRVEAGGGFATAGRATERGLESGTRRAGYARATAEARKLFTRGGGQRVTMIRAYGGVATHAPRERLVYASSLDPVQSFDNHFFRPRGGVLSGPHARYVAVGNGGLRAYDFTLAGRALAALNAEHAVRVRRFGRADRPLDVYGDAFADVGVLEVGALDAATRGGASVGGRGRWLADAGQRIGARLSFSLTDLW